MIKTKLFKEETTEKQSQMYNRGKTLDVAI